MKLIKILFSVFIAQLAGIIGSFFTVSKIPTWYATLAKPSFNPPNWLFGPVWTTLYTLMGISAYLVWEKRNDKKFAKLAKNALVFYGFQLVLNALWSIVFFGFEALGAAIIVIGFLWAMIFLTIIYSYKVSKLAAFLLIPYLLWVSFASVLNIALYLLNR